MKKFKIMVLILISLIIPMNAFAYKVNNDYLNKDLLKEVSSTVPNYTKLEEMPQDLINAVISAEDKRFFRHNGYDLLAMARAFFNDLLELEYVQGGSTITQQLAKNLFLSREKTISRKAKELFLAKELEQEYTKEQLLEMYLNVIYYGSGVHGIQNASQTFFNKDVGNLTLGECALLAGVPQAPSYYNPNKHMERAKKRQKVVLDLMAKNGYITAETSEIICKTALGSSY